MRIVDVAIRYRTSIVVLTLLLSIGGLISYITIPKESQPSIEIPNIVITTVYAGVSPDDIESLITQPIEREIQNINGIREIRSTSTEGVSTVVIEFDPTISIDDAYQRVRDKVDIAKPNLPGDVNEPIVSEIDISDFPIMTVNLAGDYSLARLKDVAERLQDELESIPSVLEVDLIGGLEREMQVDVDLARLQGYNLTFNDLVEAIQRENANIPGGSVDVERLNYLVRISGEIRDADEIRNLIISTPGGTPIYVRDIADVQFGFQERKSYSNLNILQEEVDGRLVAANSAGADPLQVISLNVKKRSGDNIIDTANRVRQIVDEFAFPPGTQVLITGDQSEMVEALVTDLENNIISGLIFVVAVLLFFLGVRNAVLVGIAIPLSMFISFIVFQTLGYTLNFIILFSLIIALGMLVDNAIVIVENIFRFREEGYSRFEAARLGTREVGGAVVASTATTVAAFFPMMFWPGIIGKFMSFLPLTLIITLSCSLFVALVINPVITGIFVKLESEPASPVNSRTRRLVILGVLLLAAIIGFANWRTLLVLAIAAPVLYYLHTRVFRPTGDRFVQKGLPRLVSAYREFLGWMLERDYTVSRPYLRNTLALGLFTGGFALTILGMLLSGFGPQVGPFGLSGWILLGPGLLMLVTGVLGIIFHTLESLYLGGRGSVRGGIIFGLITLGMVSLMVLGPRDVEPMVILEMAFLPALIIVVGLLGATFNRRTRLILTDNRAKLLNGTLGALFFIVLMFRLSPTGVVFFPATDPTQIRITAEAPLGTNLEASRQVAETVQNRVNVLLADNERSSANVKNLLLNIGVGGDFFFGGGSARPERSVITLNLVDYSDREESSTETLRRIRQQLEGIPGAELEIGQDQMGPPTGAPVNIEIRGEDFARIQQITRDVRMRLVEAAETDRIPGLVDIKDNLNVGRPEFQVRIDRERAARFGLNSRQVAQTVRAAISGAEAGQFRDGENEFDIMVRLAPEQRASLESIQNLTILYEGQQIPISAVADFEVASGLGSITRLNLSRVSTIQGGVAPGFNGNAVLAQVRQELRQYEEQMPAGYTLSYTGESEDQQESFGFLTTALLIGILLIFMILVAQFNSISTPFIIMVAVGLSLIGVLLGLIITRTPFGLFTFIGIISLAGIVVNNNIVLIDYAMQLRTRGLSKRDAIVEAGATRLRPVLLTALTTILGLIPLTFGINIDFVGLLTSLDPDFQFGSQNTQFWGPMGTAIISGLAFATFLTLVIVPVMYSSFDSISVRLGDYFGTGEHVPEEMRIGSGDGLGGGVVRPVPLGDT
jgi:multidrug efflux pump